jgi:hypothetical protein
MGEVYRAWDERLGLAVAVKVLPARLAGSPARARRLEAEARAAAQIAHPNVVVIHDVGAVDGTPYLVCELIDGETLRSRIDRGVTGREVARELGVQLARGLGAAHAVGIVHRDLKPENLLVTGDGTLKVLDFGLARHDADDSGLDSTEPGAVLGTAGFLAPEQARGEPADARSDLFAVGAILYELATGRRAFGGATFAERMSAVLRDTPPVDEATLGAIAPAVARCLEKDPKRRFQSALDLAWTLETAAAPPAPPAPSAPTRRGVLIAGGAALAGAALGFLAAPRGRRAARRDVTFEPLTFRQGRVTTARFTPGGDSVVYGAAWDGLPTAVFVARLGGGGTRALDLPAADLLAVSSRGELALSLGRRHVAGMHASGRLALSPLEGGAPRPVADDVQDADFSPDGKELAIVRRRGDRFVLELGERVLLEAPWLTHARISPDGRRIACLRHPSVEDDSGDVVVIDRASGAARVASEGWVSVAGLAWAPDGALYFTASDHGMRASLRRWRGGRVEKVAEATSRLCVHDVSVEGRAAVSDQAWRMRMMVRAPGADREVDLSLSDVSWVGDLSPDGEQVAFGELGEVEAHSGCYLRATRGGPATRLGDGQPLAIAPGGAQVAALLWPMNRIVLHPTGPGATVDLPLGSIALVRSARFAGPRELIVEGAEDGRPLRLWRVPQGGAPSPLTDEGLHGAVAIAPDGARAAFVGGDGRLRVLPLAGGDVVMVDGEHPGRVAAGWHATGAEIFVRDPQLPVQLDRVDVATGAVTPHATVAPSPVGMRGLDAFVVDATGAAYAYSYGDERSRLYVTGALG